MNNRTKLLNRISGCFFRVQVCAVLTGAVMAFALPCFAFAGSEEQVREGLYSVFEAVRSMSLPLAAAGVAGSAVKMVTGDSAEAAAAGKRIVLILTAVAALWLVPAALSLGAGLFSGIVWNPGG